VNFTHVAGHLGADPETRFTQSGKKVTKLRVAARTRRKAAADSNDYETIWWSITIWGDTFDKIIPFFKKGSGIMVFGEMNKPEIFNDRDGKPQVAMELIAVHIGFSPFGKPGGSGPYDGGAGGAQHQSAPQSPFGKFPENAPNPYMGSAGEKVSTGPSSQGETFDDEVPF
jgi:single-strand DNA-binding protein